MVGAESKSESDGNNLLIHWRGEVTLSFAPLIPPHLCIKVENHASLYDTRLVCPTDKWGGADWKKGYGLCTQVCLTSLWTGTAARLDKDDHVCAGQASRQKIAYSLEPDERAGPREARVGRVSRNTVSDHFCVY